MISSHFFQQNHDSSECRYTNALKFPIGPRTDPKKLQGATQEVNNHFPHHLCGTWIEMISNNLNYAIKVFKS